MKKDNIEINQYRKHEMYGRPMRSTGNNGVFKITCCSGASWCRRVCCEVF